LPILGGKLSRLPHFFLIERAADRSWPKTFRHCATVAGANDIMYNSDMNPRTTAVVLIEYQNDFTTPGGKLHEAVKPVMESTNMLENTVEMVKAAREAGATIVYVPIQFAPGFRELSPNPYGILKGCKDGAVFEKGSWGAQVVDVLKPQPEDIVIEGKRGLDSFATTNLDFILRSRKIDTIALGGFLTNCCVESTMRTGYELGYDVITIKDCAATVSEEAHSGAIEHDFPMFSHPMTHDEFVSALKTAEPKQEKVSVGAA
jgi:ureidoacrylate peracid hydrolase